jgi:biopolymer transport protein ExbD
MLGVRLTSWQTYEPEWGLEYLWRRLDWISRLDVFVLAVMFAYVVVVASRSSYRYRKALPESRAHVRALTADFSRRVRSLRSISHVAPYLGLAGTCFGILDSFRAVGMQKNAAIAMVTTNIVASALTTAFGVLVALSAACSLSYLLWLREKLELNVDPHWRSPVQHFDAGRRVFSKYPLRRKFSKLPAFALVAAPGIASVLVALMCFSSFRVPMGLDVRLLQMRPIETSNARVQPLFIGLSEMSGNEKPEIYLDSKKTTWDHLDSSLSDSLKARPQPTVYVEAADDVRWAYVLTLIDSAKTHSDDVVLLTAAPEGDSGHVHRSARSKK